MKRILVLGAGRSATCLIDYLISHSNEKNHFITIADVSIDLIESKTEKHPNTKAIELDASDSLQREKLIAHSDLVISMLPPHMHILVAHDCLKHSKHLLSASYIDPAIKELEEEVRQKGLVFLFEMGLDPGIDHMSAVKIFDEIRISGGKITSFKSHCGGLVAPESDDNPWHYKISWNPRNIIQAGMAGALYKLNGEIQNIPYHQLFNVNQTVHVPEEGELGWYANRDSLGYIPLYGLYDVETIVRTTLRHPDFIMGWNHIVNLKLTSTDRWITDYNLSGQEFFTQHLMQFGLKSRFESIMKTPEAQKLKQLFENLGLLNISDPVTQNCHSSFDVLLKLAESKWKLKKDDKDMIVMLHEIEFLDASGSLNFVASSLVMTGKDPLRTAMAETVGLPLGIAAGLVLEDKIHQKGVIIPTCPEIYNPVLHELDSCGIRFKEVRWTA
jgi:saccharopine dehydrogenase (NADP+, L-glutamate forming)